MTENNRAFYITAADLAEAGMDGVPEELQSSKHLIYSSPAALSFNSPGAQGFGVKRAALAVPGSIELLVAPGCCGRNTTILSRSGGYRDRFFYLLMDDTDIVTGRHLKKIPEAVKEAADSCEERPSCVMICITCVDALLGTDMERVCRKASEYAGLPVLPSYMYALTREGREPPMNSVRKSIYSLLEKTKRRSNVVNLMGEFAPLTDDSEIYQILKAAGVKKINEISRMKDFDEYLKMSEANFNIIINPECRLAAGDLNKRLGMPYIELRKLHQPAMIHRQYELFGSAIGAEIDDSVYREKAETAIKDFTDRYPGASFAIGETLNGDTFEIALSLLRSDCRVPEIYGTVSGENFVYVKRIAEISPETRIYTNLSPSMIYYDCSEQAVDVTIGADAAYYHPDAPNVAWNQDVQPFGYAAVEHLYKALSDAMDRREN
ncbi:MAG: nitrogenase component 1 [Anaerovoracaceae bacterium]|nr:nitrogenase component 1 [Bacillota bacterium]MDY2670207.1 nitrogenase component 1 [Anaerovoracaceae bacterium]